jgi:hypothetical protein
MEQITEDSSRAGFKSRELADELEAQKQTDKLSRDIFRDFYQTFRLAQGSIETQALIFARLGQEHRAAGHTDNMPGAFIAAEPRLAELMPPRAHKETTAEDRAHDQNGFQAMWDNYMGSLVGRPSEETQGVSDEYLVTLMLAKDSSYQFIHRPGRTEADDTHESVVREYVLGDKLQGSAELLKVRDHLRQALLNPAAGEDGENVQRRLNKVAPQWEYNHPGQTFLPSAERQ